MEDDASRNPEADNFRYIHLILESLNRLGCLDAAVNTMEQRLPVELFTIVNRTNQEVDLRHPSHLRNLQSDDRQSLNLGHGDKSNRNDVLNDLLSTLYAKLEAIAEGHRAVHDVVVGITKREGLGSRKNLSGGFKEMWKLYQSEVMIFVPHITLPTDHGRCAPCSMITLQQMVILPLGSVECPPQKPMSSKRFIEIRPRHVNGFRSGNSTDMV